MKNKDETKNCFAEIIEQNKLMSKKHSKVYSTLNYIEHFFILASVVTECISIPAFAPLLGILIRILSSAIQIEIKNNCRN